MNGFEQATTATLTVIRENLLSGNSMTDLTNQIAGIIRDIDSRGHLSADGLATFVCRSLYDKGIIRLNQVRPIGAFITANANMDPKDLAEAIVTDFQLGNGAGQ